MSEQNLNQLVIDLFNVNAIKITNVVLKTGYTSPIYIDLRVIVSYPQLLNKIAQEIWSTCLNKGSNPTCDVICGVPYTALPIATCISLKRNIPMVVRRKEAKSYGTKKIIEGVFKEGDKVILIEDVLTSGTSVLETANALMQCGLKVTDAVVLIDRNQGGLENLQREGINCKCVLDLKQLTSILHVEEKIDSAKRDSIISWLLNNQCDFSAYSLNEKNLLSQYRHLKLHFDERIKQAKEKSIDGVNVKLMQIISEKRSNLCVSIDVDSCTQVLEIASKVAPNVCAIKIHVDILTDFSYESLIEPLKKLSRENNFLIIEDRKFADIGNTVRLQYNCGIFKIIEWADLVTAHTISGPSVVTGLKCEAQKMNDKRGVLLIAEMSSHANLLTKANVEAAYNLAKEHADFVSGFICQHQITTDPTVLHFTPGVSMSCDSDSLGQRYVTPEIAIANGTDVAIVGRGITSANDVQNAAQEYQERLYDLYLKNCNA